jgi:metal-responsive CopG/Arc/MetJ family transcriptional regulator
MDTHDTADAPATPPRLAAMVSMRFAADELAAIDQYVEAHRPAIRSRSEAIRELVRRGISRSRAPGVTRRR